MAKTVVDLKDKNGNVLIPNVFIDTNGTPSDTNTYNANALKKMFGGTILWTNPNPENEFTPQEITLNSSDYDFYKIIFKTATTDPIVTIVEGIKGLGVCMIYINPYEIEYRIGARRVFFVDNTHLSFDNGYYKMAINNIACIPLYVIGYNTGLFD